MATRELHRRLQRLQARPGAQYLPCVVVVPGTVGPRRAAALAQVQRLRQQGRHVIELPDTARHLALHELAEVFAP